MSFQIPHRNNGRPSTRKASGSPTFFNINTTGALLVIIVSVGTIQVLLTISYHNNFANAPPSTNNNHPALISSQRHSSSDGNGHDRSVSAFWWPSPETSGGFLSAIHNAQHPKDCSAKSTKYFVMQSLKNNDGDNRGLSAWASITMQHMLHAFSDSDDNELQSNGNGGRVLINDEKMWPMAKGCKHGTKKETRECYFLPLSNCALSDADPIIDSKTSVVAVLAEAKDEYDHSARTLYSSSKSKYAVMAKHKYAWSGLPGGPNDHSHTQLTAAFLAYYLQPQPWLEKEIDARLRRSVPSDLDPARTIGVPIRRSDKCFGHDIAGSAGGELDCPPMETYLAAVKDFLKFDPLIRNVIVTSEDSSARSDFVTLLGKELPNLRVVTNVGDVMQGTGSASQLEADNNKNNRGGGGSSDTIANEDAIASALTSFHMHLRARYFVVTTKSNWTASIAIFARVFGFSRGEVYVVDIGKNKNGYADIARKSG